LEGRGTHRETKGTWVQRDLHGVRKGGGRRAKKRANAARGCKERGRGGGKEWGGCDARAQIKERMRRARRRESMAVR